MIVRSPEERGKGGFIVRKKKDGRESVEPAASELIAMLKIS
jgi:hypothetical protein